MALKTRLEGAGHFESKVCQPLLVTQLAPMQRERERERKLRERERERERES
jgi:hypothetical protein